MKIRLLLVSTLFVFQGVLSQNLLNTDSWNPENPITEQGEFQSWGDPSNEVITASNPFGNQVPIWQTSCDGNFPGFAVQNISIDYNATYRFTVWVKMTNSDTHNYALKASSTASDGFIRGDGSTIKDAYFTSWKLPVRDSWFLVVGYIKGNGSSQSFPDKGIYKEATFEQSSLNYETFRFNTTSNKITITTITFNSTDSNDKAFYYDPRVEMLNGQQPSIDELLNNSDNLPSGETVWNTSGSNISYSDGNVGIGIDNPDAPLTVKGQIHTQEVKVDLDGVLVPDYVFKKEYNLKTLEEVQLFINEHGHLPNIPSAEEFAKEGMELKQMNLKLLEKIEELTLYIIEQEKSQKALEKRIKILETKRRN